MERTRIPWLVLVITVLVTSALVVAHDQRGVTGPTVLVAVGTALVAAIGALFSPVAVGGPNPAPAEARRRKTWQLLVAGLVTSALAWIPLLGSASSGIASIAGIVAAGFVGSAMSRQNAPGEPQRE